MAPKISSIDKIRKKHLTLLKKNNAITDSKNGLLSLGAMKTGDILLKKYQDINEYEFSIELSELRHKLGLSKNQDYVDRIKEYLRELKLPYELKNYIDDNGKEVEWSIVSFINNATVKKETNYKVDISISKDFINYLVDRAGYTTLNLDITKKFKTKYGYKIYEMYLRYYSLPNRISNDMGVIEKTLEELNFKFGSKFSYVSKMNEGIERGVKEVKKITGEDVYCFFNKEKKVFVFSWEKKKTLAHIKNSTSIIPQEMLDELVDWIVMHTKSKIDDIQAYKHTIKNLILKNEYEEVELKYHGLLMHRYKFTEYEIQKTKNKYGVYEVPNLQDKSLF